ncbi:hypothetical protein DFH09DRAFT_1375716 [Mycena vulgaris]|nr:hypothetical protein DFH09DRAFT_1375716 [Mycena vulgaris]
MITSMESRGAEAQVIVQAATMCMLLERCRTTVINVLTNAIFWTFYMISKTRDRRNPAHSPDWERRLSRSFMAHAPPSAELRASASGDDTGPLATHSRVTKAHEIPLFMTTPLAPSQNFLRTDSQSQASWLDEQIQIDVAQTSLPLAPAGYQSNYNWAQTPLDSAHHQFNSSIPSSTTGYNDDPAIFSPDSLDDYLAAHGLSVYPFDLATFHTERAHDDLS